MSESRLMSAIGFAMKAGKCYSGEVAVQKVLGSQRALLILLDSSASKATLKRWAERSINHGIECLEVENLGGAIGRGNRMVAAITDRGFADMIKGIYTKAPHNGADNGGVC